MMFKLFSKIQSAKLLIIIENEQHAGDNFFCFFLLCLSGVMFSSEWMSSADKLLYTLRPQLYTAPVHGPCTSCTRTLYSQYMGFVLGVQKPCTLGCTTSSHSLRVSSPLPLGLRTAVSEPSILSFRSTFPFAVWPKCNCPCLHE